MNRDLRTLLVLIAVVAVAGVASYRAFVEDERRRTHLTAGATAEITEVFVARERNPDTGGSGNISFVRIGYRYEAGGRTYDKVVTMGKAAGMRFKIGGAAKACYDPQQPGGGELFEAGYECGG